MVIFLENYKVSPCIFDEIGKWLCKKSITHEYHDFMCFNSVTFSKSRGWKFLSTSQANCDIQLNVDLAPFSSVTSLGKGMRTSNKPLLGENKRISKPKRSTHIIFASVTYNRKSNTLELEVNIAKLTYRSSILF